MVSGQVLLICAVSAGLWFGGRELVKGVKKVTHETTCLAKTGHPCEKPKK